MLSILLKHFVNLCSTRKKIVYYEFNLHKKIKIFFNFPLFYLTCFSPFSVSFCTSNVIIKSEKLKRKTEIRQNRVDPKIPPQEAKVNSADCRWRNELSSKSTFAFLRQSFNQLLINRFQMRTRRWVNMQTTSSKTSFHQQLFVQMALYICEVSSNGKELWTNQ